MHPTLVGDVHDVMVAQVKGRMHTWPLLNINHVVHDFRNYAFSTRFLHSTACLCFYYILQNTRGIPQTHLVLIYLDLNLNLLYL
jgi:hypothetical protein